MPDKVLICQNCQNPFVYSEYEQYNHAKDNKPAPLYCPICQSIKTQEAKRPSKPKVPVV
ncbi:cytochrome C551 [bacterium]|nr:MAG: cytochrome C551 [bacterium]